MRRRRRADDPRPVAQARGELAAPADADVPVSLGMTPAGPTVVWAARRSADGEQGRSFVIATYDRAACPTGVVRCAGLPKTDTFVDRFADGSFLVVESRCTWTPSGPEQNARIIDTDGRVVRQGCLGDGLMHMQVDIDDTIWAGYSDEGIFGNLGWNRPGPPALGAAGLVAWSPTFEKTWQMDESAGLFAECDALNVHDGVVTVCPYTDFPVVRITSGRPAVYTTEDIHGPRGIIASGNRIGLVGALDDPALLVVGELSDGHFVEHRRTHVTGLDRNKRSVPGLLCRGAELHYLEGTRWFSLSLDDVQ